MASEPQRDSRTDTASWGARFGWLAGGLAGLLVGFVLTFALEHALRGVTRDAMGMASKLSSLVVPGMFVVGALSGHAFGGAGGATRYKSLGVAAGVLIALTGWAALVLLR